MGIFQVAALREGIVMEEFIVQTYFTDVTRCKYIYEFNIPRDHSFSGLKASIANMCTVSLAELSFEGNRFLVLSACWTKPHYFIINTTNCNIMWTEGTQINEDLKFTKQYTVLTSLNSWISTLRALAKDQLLVEWAQCGRFIKPASAKKKLAKLAASKE